jgi:hypothetical protein
VNYPHAQLVRPVGIEWVTESRKEWRDGQHRTEYNHGYPIAQQDKIDRWFGPLVENHDEAMVHYGAHPNRNRIEAAERIAESHAGTENVHSFTSGEKHVIDANGNQMIVHILRGKYDIRVDGEIMAKFASWEDAKRKFRWLLEQGEESGTAAD